ncbi:MAG: type II secretion system protein N [bacterium]|nr:hypothetical protein [Gammaproteobacteria bacterium]HIL98556.1 hypothetical protein [Pseudomonadales bacterium]
MKVLLYFVAALLSFIIFMAVLTPAAVVWRLISDEVSIPNLQVYQVSGTLWNGQAELKYRQFPISSLHWEIDPLSLVYGDIELEFLISGDSHEFSGEALLGHSRVAIVNLRGTLGSRYINDVSRSQGYTISGEFEVRDVNLATDFRLFNDAGGRVYWSGGRIVSLNEPGTRVWDLPSLEGDLDLVDSSVELLIHREQASVVDIRLKPDGWMSVTIKGRLLSLAKLPLPSATGMQDTVLEFEEKVFWPRKSSGEYFEHD